MAIVTIAVCVGCGKSDNNGQPQDPLPTVLTIYVYSPDKPVVTRANEDDVNATAAENNIHSLQIWVFAHDSGELVGYLQPSATVLNRESAYAFLMDVSDAFATTLPNVDVYVMANAPDSGLGQESTQEEIEAAILNNAANADFGIGRVTTDVPATGLPMTGVLRNQPVTGNNPVLRIGTLTEMATVRLTRVVSKICFYFTRQSSVEESITIGSITIDGNMIPQEEYLFLADDGKSYHIGSEYEEQAAELASAVGVPAMSESPDQYLFMADMEGQEYVDMMETAATSGYLTKAGPFYLRESDLRLGGTIDYQVNGVSRQTTFQMADALDFSRNHTWIIYGYFNSGSNGNLGLSNLFIRDWREVGREHEVYNW